jgi:hypothetical protein
MFNRKLSTVIAAGLLLSAVSAHAAGSVFPSSVSEVGHNWPATDTLNASAQAPVGATGRVFPSSAAEFGDADHRTGIGSRTSAEASMAGITASTFPASPNETGRIFR